MRGRHHLGGEPLELLEAHRFRHADRQTDRDAVEAGVTPFEALQMLDDLLRRAAQEAAIGDGIFDPG